MTNLLPAAFQSGQPLAIWPAAYDGARQQFETSTLTLEQVTAKVPVSLASGSVRPEDRLYLLQNGAAVIRIDGVMTNRLHWPGFCCSNVVTAYAVRQAARDEEVKSILIVGSSPGGTVLGLEDLHRDVKDAASQKPTTFFVDGYACSAAYYVACATSRIVINRTGWTGSLGSMMVQTESKGAYDQMGIKVHVFSTGPLKGQGTSGTELSEAFKSEIQRLVDSAGAEFASVISDGRKMDPDDVAEVFTGGVFTAPEALRLRLVDAIGTLDDALADLLAMAEGADEDGGALDQSARSTAPTTPGASPSGQRVQPPAQPISAPGGQPGPAGTTQAPTQGAERKTTPMSLRQNLINRMGAMGFGRIVAGLNGTQSDDPEVLARIITDDVTAQAQELHQNNPILATLRARGITDHAGLDGLLAQANAGNEYVNDLRSEAKKEAIRALGAEDATPLLTSIATMGLADARAWRDHYRSKADAQFGTGGGTRPVRQTAAANASAADVDQPPAKKRLWERLPAEDRATAAKSCDLSTEAKQDAFAESLFAKTPQVFEEAI